MLHGAAVWSGSNANIMNVVNCEIVVRPYVHGHGMDYFLNFFPTDLILQLKKYGYIMRDWAAAAAIDSTAKKVLTFYYCKRVPE